MKLRISPPFRGRVGVSFCVFGFSLTLIWVYINFLTRFDYLGFTYRAGALQYSALSIAALLISAWLLPTQISRLSDSLLWFTYWLLYAPIVLLVPLQDIDSVLKNDFLICLFTSFVLMVGCSAIQWRPIPILKISRFTFVTIFSFSYGLLTMWVLYLFGGHMQLPGLADVYELRSQNEHLVEGNYGAYVLGMLGWAFNPFLISVGLVERKMWLIAVGVFGQVLLFMCLGHKGILLTTVIMLLFYKLFIAQAVPQSGRLAILMLGIAFLPLVPLLYIDMGFIARDSIVSQVVSIVYMRSFGMVAAVMGVYISFFQANPYTYYSHINVVSNFVHYPYDRSLGEVIGFDLVNSELNANASFYATDGYAALGAPGVIVMGLVMGIFFSLASKMTLRAHKVACTAFIPFVMIVSNSSLFTSLLTGGGGILLVLVYLYQSLPKRPRGFSSGSLP